MSAPDPRNVRDALLEAGHTPEEVEVMLLAAEASRELLRLERCFDKASGLRFEDFARRDQARAHVALRLISDINPGKVSGHQSALHPLDSWREQAHRYSFET